MSEPPESNEDQISVENDQDDDFWENQGDVGEGWAGNIQQVEVASGENEDRQETIEDNKYATEADNKDEDMGGSDCFQQNQAEVDEQADHPAALEALDNNEDQDEGVDGESSAGDRSGAYNKGPSYSQSSDKIENNNAEDDDPDQSKWDKYNEMEEAEAEISGWQQLLEFNEMLEYEDGGDPTLQDVHDIFRRHKLFRT
ncbi:hypothetical protein CPB83DRAFT_900051 [Crepidotus variabilis]|uniref:Uncharacterized protein n=1 Tax=Crepidotus variabilis TaxID=179855 RepID=A0A9P6E3X0_9AGAR|nr:hypothetical protein CPB83DRAFT_900051 [Crepidotus variabilis]